MCGQKSHRFSCRFRKNGWACRSLLAGLFLAASLAFCWAQESPGDTTSQGSTGQRQTPSTTENTPKPSQDTFERNLSTLSRIIDQLERNSNSEDSIMSQLSQLSTEQLSELKSVLPLLLNMSRYLSKIDSYTSRLETLLPLLEKLTEPSTVPKTPESNWSAGAFAGYAYGLSGSSGMFAGAFISYRF